MFRRLLHKDPRKALERRYRALLRAARDLQRGGDVVAAAARTAEAETVRRQLEATDRGSGSR